MNISARILAVSALLFSVFCATVLAASDIEVHRSCSYCGMDRKAYGYSRMLVQYEDGSEIGLCSLSCVVTELDASSGKKVKSFLVADRNTRKLIDAEKAVWVIGGSKKGVMTERPKWAFGAVSAAEEFISSYGGVMVDWSAALKAASDDARPKKRR